MDWSQRESVRASLRLMVKCILHKYKYLPDLADATVKLVLQKAEALGAELNVRWSFIAPNWAYHSFILQVRR